MVAKGPGICAEPSNEPPGGGATPNDPGIVVDPNSEPTLVGFCRDVTPQGSSVGSELNVRPAGAVDE
jgi:hypothetical protein